jgi:hypothetical protein
MSHKHKSLLSGEFLVSIRDAAEQGLRKSDKTRLYSQFCKKNELSFAELGMKRVEP